MSQLVAPSLGLPSLGSGPHSASSTPVLTSAHSSVVGADVVRPSFDADAALRWQVDVSRRRWMGGAVTPLTAFTPPAVVAGATGGSSIADAASRPAAVPPRSNDQAQSQHLLALPAPGVGNGSASLLALPSPGPSSCSTPRSSQCQVSTSAALAAEATAGAAAAAAATFASGAKRPFEPPASALQSHLDLRPAPMALLAEEFSIPRLSPDTPSQRDGGRSKPGDDKAPASGFAPVVTPSAPASSVGSAAPKPKARVSVDLTRLEVENPVIAKPPGDTGSNGGGSNASGGRASRWNIQRRPSSRQEPVGREESTSGRVGKRGSTADDVIAAANIDEAVMAKLRQIFDRLHREHSNTVTKRDLIRLCRNDIKVAEFFQLPRHIHQEDGSRDVFERCFQDIDRDGDREISWQEFSMWFAKKYPQEENRRRSVSAFFRPPPVARTQAKPAPPSSFGPSTPLGSSDEQERLRPNDRGPCNNAERGAPLAAPASSAAAAVALAEGALSFSGASKASGSRSGMARGHLSRAGGEAETHQGLGGALSAHGAPSEWWHDSIILGRLSAVAMRYFSTKALSAPWEAWRDFLEQCRAKRRQAETSYRQLARKSLPTLLWHWRVSGKRWQKKLPLILALQKLPAALLRPWMTRLQQVVFAHRNIQRRLKLLYLVEWKMLNTLARAHYYQSLLRLGLAGFWMAAQIAPERPPRSCAAASAHSGTPSVGADVVGLAHGHVGQVLRRVWRRWHYATQMWMTSAEYRVRETEAWLAGECTTPRSIATSLMLQGFSFNPVVEQQPPRTGLGPDLPFPNAVDSEAVVYTGGPRSAFGEDKANVPGLHAFAQHFGGFAMHGLRVADQADESESSGPVQLSAHTAVPAVLDSHHTLQRLCVSGLRSTSQPGRAALGHRGQSGGAGTTHARLAGEPPITEPPQRRLVPGNDRDVHTWTSSSAAASSVRQFAAHGGLGQANQPPQTHRNFGCIDTHTPGRPRRNSAGSEPDYAFVEPEAPSELASDAGGTDADSHSVLALGFGEPDAGARGGNITPSGSPRCGHNADGSSYPGSSSLGGQVSAWMHRAGGDFHGVDAQAPDDAGDYYAMRGRLAKQQQAMSARARRR